MAERASGLRPVVVGASHVSSGAALRDRLLVPPEEMADMLSRLRAANLGQALCLSTCARTEVQATHEDPEAAAHAVTRLLASRAGVSEAALTQELYAKTDEAAVRHIFTVAASLDSPVIGEPHVLGQLKESHRAAREAGLVGAELETLLQAAYGAAKRTRTETPLGERPVSLAAAAADVARDIHGDLARCDALLLAGDEMGEVIVDRLRESGLARIVVAARLPQRAAALARQFGGHHASLDELPRLLAASDIVVTALGTGTYTLTRELVQGALAARRKKPIYFVDSGVPTDVEPAVGALDDAFVYDLDDLEGIVLEGRERRRQAADAAEAIVAEEVEAYLRDQAARSAAPSLTALRRHFEAMREAVLRDQPEADAGQATRLLINRLLHRPSQRLRSAAERGTAAEETRTLGTLFGLDDADDKEDRG